MLAKCGASNTLGKENAIFLNAEIVIILLSLEAINKITKYGKFIYIIKVTKTEFYYKKIKNKFYITGKSAPSDVTAQLSKSVFKCSNFSLAFFKAATPNNNRSGGFSEFMALTIAFAARTGSPA